MQGAQVWSLVRKLNSHMPCSQKINKQNFKTSFMTVLSVSVCLTISKQNKPHVHFNFLNLFSQRLITLQYCGGFCHTLTWIKHGCTCIPHPECPSHLPPHSTPQGQPSTPALSTLSHASNLDWRSISHMVIYMFQCSSLKSSNPHLLP